MPVDSFTLEEFEATLANFGYEFRREDFDLNEYCFAIPYRGIFIRIRSSIGENGRSDGVGENSIRLNMWRDGDYLGKIDAYTTRVYGWQDRLHEKIELLKHFRDMAGDCPVCHQPLGVFKVKKEGPNKGKLFARCSKDDTFRWLDERGPEGMFFDIPVDEEKDVEPLSTNAENVIEAVFTDSQSGEAQASYTVGVDFSTQPDQTVYNLEEILALLPEEEIIIKGEPNDYQRAIIEAPVDQPMRVLAGPGSGKTYTISYRYQSMVVDRGILPMEIVVVTFNKLAADNMLRKIVELCPIPPEAQNQICTIHALCNRCLRHYYKEFAKLTLASDFAIKKLLEKMLPELEPVAEVRPGWEETLSWINTSKAHNVRTENVSQWFLAYHPEAHISLGDLLQECRQRLDDALRAENQWTFSDMQYEMEQALDRDPDFRAFWQRRFKYLIVDEAQDTAAQAIRILTKLFFHTNQIMMVGDGDQLLYRFTGATPESTLYEGFDKRYPVNHTFMLPINYRSTPNIVEASKRIILNNYEPIGPYADRFFKNMEAAPGMLEGPDPVITEAPNAIAEAHAVLAMVKQFIQDGYEPGSFFIGARTRAQIGYLEAAFAPSDVPYVNVVGTSFFDLPHIRHVLAYMQLVADSRNEEAFRTVYNVASNNMKVPWTSAIDYGEYCSHRFLSAEFLGVARHYVGMLELQSYHTRIKPKPSWKPGMEDLSSLMFELQAAAEEGPGALVEAIVDLCYRKYVISQSGGEEGVGEGSKLDDIGTIRDLANSFVKLSDFVQYVDNVIAASKAAQNKDWTGRVVLATIHRLKGLERPIVIGVGMSEGVDGQTGLLPHTFALVDPPNNGKLPGDRRGYIEDERCLFFVLVSRAQKLVVLSSVGNYREKPMRPSRFLAELAQSS